MDMAAALETVTEAGTDTETVTETTETEPPDLSNWKKLVELIHIAFREGCLVEEATWQTDTLIPKGGVTTVE